MIISPVPVQMSETAGAMPTNRSFGLVFTVVFLLVALLPLRRGIEPRWWAVAAAAVVLALALGSPRLLGPANYAWFRIGRLLHRVVSPAVMALLFYLVITPVGLMRRLGRQGLSRTLRADDRLTTYWIQRPGRFSPMDQQF